MARYTKDSIDRVKDAVDMVELVGARTELRRVGSRWTGLCPFHDERTPSFSVNAEEKLYYCFGCSEAGDAIRFVEATEGLDFPEAVEMLAERYRVELKREQEDPRAEERRQREERLRQLVERAAKFYERHLWESKEALAARRYLVDRGFTEETLREFRVGYSPSAWDKLLLAAQRDGFSQQDLAAAGLVQRGRDGRVYDRFRGRIMFPLADHRGRVLGFGARALTEEQRPKYLNTSENELYHKGRQLFGIDRAAGAAAKRGRIVAVEGYTDVLALHQGGITESVAIMGTALTQQQLSAFAQRVGKGTVYLALDADRAGQEAMLRAARGAEDLELELRVVEMPEGQDPAELIAAEGPNAFVERINDAREVPDFEARRLIRTADRTSADWQNRALDRVRPLITQLRANSATREELAEFVADKLDVPLALLEAELKAPSPPAPVPTSSAPTPSFELSARLERDVLAMCVASGEEGREVLGRLDDAHFTSETLRLARDHLVRHFDDPLVNLPEGDPALSALLTEVAMRGEAEPTSLEALRLAFLQLDLRKIDRQLRHAHADSDFARQKQLWPARENVRAQIDELMGQTT